MSNNSKKEEIELLLPFYVNGSLNAIEKEMVEQALVDDLDLQQELIYLQTLHRQIQQQKHDNSPGELGLKRLQHALLAEQKTFTEGIEHSEQSSSINRWRFAAIAACLMLIVQTVVDYEPGLNIYTAAGGKPTISQYQGQVISVTFAPNATEQAIRRLFLDANTSIVDGPSALGIYRLSVSGNLEQVIMLFTAHPELIESVQRDQ